MNVILVIQKMPKDVPDEIIRTILGFLSFKDNTNNLFVSKKFCRIIGKGGIQLNQRQEVSMRIRMIRDVPRMVDFSNGEMTVRITDGRCIRRPGQKIHIIEGQVGVEFPGLKHIIVNELLLDEHMVQFDIFEHIKDRMLGGHLLPIKKVQLQIFDAGGAMQNITDHSPGGQLMPIKRLLLRFFNAELSLQILARFRDIHSSTYSRNGSD